MRCCKGRRRRGPLELDLPERKLILDAHGLIERVVTPERLDAHKLIEEFMIQANVAAAETLEAAQDAAALSRPRAAFARKRSALSPSSCKRSAFRSPTARH